MKSESSAVAGSFRDRDGRVYLCDGRIFRGLSAAALAAFHALGNTRFYRRSIEQNRLIASTVVPGDEVPLSLDDREQWAGFIEHPRLPFISYPYEWTFGMLREAALLHLELLEGALLEGMTLKDATPYNIQFFAGKPVFIDITSFEPLEAGAPWAGYRQFCEMFLFPLMLQAYKGIDFQPLLRARIDGVDVQTASKLFNLRDRIRRGVFGHVWLQAKLDRRHACTQQNVRSDLKAAGFNRELILANVRKLQSVVTRLEWQGIGSWWGGYESFHNYSGADHQAKETFVDECVGSSGADTVWDIGCNAGQFSKIAARHAKQVIAMDVDHFAVERLYRGIREQDIQGIQPLIQDVADPSPNWGWRQKERTDLRSRSAPDMILCLALIHHLVITANIPLAECVEWLAGLAPQLIIEYVSRRDDKVQMLLRNKADKYTDYSRENLEFQLRRHFRIAKSQALGSGNRFLYWARSSQ